MTEATETTEQPEEVFLDVRNLRKTFPGVVAVDDVSFDVRRGEVHVIVGENGAGKSSLMKMLTGVYDRDGGEITVDGEPYVPGSPMEAEEEGISMIYQEFNLAPHLSIYENINLGRETVRAGGWLDNRTGRARANEALDRLNVEIDVPLSTPVRHFGYAKQQMIEIAKALVGDAELMIMDEPTAALPKQEIQSLFDVMRRLTDEGLALIFISHQLEEVKEIGDRATVLRDGKKVGTNDVSELEIPDLIRMMVGRELDEMFPEVDAEHGDEAIRVEHLEREGVLHDVNFSVKKGEVLGVTGLVGAGRTEMVRAIFGADPVDGGTVYLEGEPARIDSPKQAIDQGVGLVTEDRRNEGLAMDLSLKDNVTLANLNKFLSYGWIREGDETESAKSCIEELDIRCRGPEQGVRYLSGGNQQKVVVAKWLLTESRVMIFDEPTRGIDVGAKSEMFELIGRLAEQGVAVIMISSYMPEVLGMSDRILVMAKGRVSTILDREEATQEKIMSYATVGEEAV